MKDRLAVGSELLALSVEIMSLASNLLHLLESRERHWNTADTLVAPSTDYYLDQPAKEITNV
jgi:hypothetical protein